LLVNMLRGRGNLLKTTQVWKPRNGAGFDFGAVQEKLGQRFDSGEGGPHQPSASGPHATRAHGSDDSVIDSVIYVAYHPSQCLPEFNVTYTVNSSYEWPELSLPALSEARQPDRGCVVAPASSDLLL